MLKRFLKTYALTKSFNHPNVSLRFLKEQNLRIIIYEYVSGGGFAEQPLLPSVLSEGFAMLRSVVFDFKAAGHEVTVLLDERLSRLNPPIVADCTIPVFCSKDPKDFLRKIAKINDAIYIVAPETRQILKSMVELAEQTGMISLNCEPSAIRKVADKRKLHEMLQKLGAKPKTIILKISDGSPKIKQAIKNSLNYPVVLKPTDGVSCGGLSIVKEPVQLERAIEKIKEASASEFFVVQEFINGTSASISLLSTGKKALALSLNKQNITLVGPEDASSYDGGTVPLDHPLKKEALSIAEKLVESIEGLRGYVGVDLILSDDKIFVVDVNPRLTTSYVGLCRVTSFNLAEAIVNSVLKGTLPTKPEIREFSCFSKIETNKPSFTVFQKASKLYSVISPPFPLNENTTVSSIVIGKGESLENAGLRLEEAKKRLLDIIS